MVKKFLTILVALTILLGSPTTALASGRYHAGSSYHSNVSSGTNYHSGSSPYGTLNKGGTYHSGYTYASPGTRAYGGWFGKGSSRFGLGHLGSFAGGFILGSMFHPFGWGFGGGYGGPGYSPAWSLLGIVVDILLLALIVFLISRFLRGFSRRSSISPVRTYAPSFAARSPLYRNLDEQALVDACCEFVASRERCYPQDVAVDLTFDRDTETFGAEILVSGGRAYPLLQQDLVDAVANFVASRERVHTKNVNVDLQFDERFGVHASVRIA